MSISGIDVLTIDMSQNENLETEVTSHETIEDNSEQEHSDRNSSNGEPECTICMCPLSQSPDGNENNVSGTRTLACGHVFHTHCIDTWLVRNNHCPLCRTEVQLISRRFDTIEVRIPGVVSTVLPDIRRIFIRQLLFISFMPIIAIYDMSKTTYSSTYAMVLLFFVNLITVGMITPFVKSLSQMTRHHLFRTHEVFSTLPAIRVSLLTMFIASRIIEINKMDGQSYVAVLLSTMNLADDFIFIATLTPVVMYIRLQNIR